MRLARRALLAALTMLLLCAAASAQTLRPETDPRNIAPTVGTGGPVGGPTGLFTIYDGQTLRRGEFTFSIAYSNFDRDPGNVDLTEVPVSFQVGLSDHLELFFNTDAYRGIKVNSPTHLSGFYLPNSQLFFGGTPALRSGPAIVLAPTGTVGTLAGTAVFRPTGNQPFVTFPYVGGSAGTFGQGPGRAGVGFGFPGFNAILGVGGTAETSNFFGQGAADAFPGIGSPFGSILPGVVLATATLPGTLLALPTTVPTTFTIAPTYLPDAPFINRLYGESSFSTFVVGGKIRFTGPNNPFGFGIIPFYRFYADKPDDTRGFNQLQRGASPGGDRGDFGLVLFADGRLSRSVNISVNGGYILNSNPQSDLFGRKATLLDRPDEFIAGIGFDFPVNRHFQPIAELRSTQYVGGRTPNAFENSPVEGLVGVRIYPTRYMGFSLAYRRHFNQQSADLFEDQNFNTTIGQITNVNVRGTVVVVPGTTRAATANGLPLGFRESDDPNGYLAQFWIGHRNARSPEFLPNQPPTVSIAASSATVQLAPQCPPDTDPATTCPAPTSEQVQLTTTATDPDGDTLLYTYSTTGGRITGEGPNVTWDLAGVQPGSYTATVEVDDGCGCVAFSTTTVTVNRCTECVPRCPTAVTVTCPTEVVQEGTPVTFTANVAGGPGTVTPTYTWTVSAGRITSGEGTNTITVDTTGLGGQSITATVDVGGFAATCPHTASCTTTIGRPTPPTRFDTYGNIRFNDEKARLDNFAIQLQGDPGTTGTIIAYGSCEGEGQTRADRARDYLVNTRGIEAGRITTIDGGCRAELTVELWLVPQGATAPAAQTEGTVSPCPACRATTRRATGRRGARRRR